MGSLFREPTDLPACCFPGTDRYGKLLIILSYTGSAVPVIQPRQSPAPRRTEKVAAEIEATQVVSFLIHGAMRPGNTVIGECSMSVEQIQAEVDALAARLGRAVAADDEGLRLIAVSEDFGDADPARIWSLLHRRTRPEDVRYTVIKQLPGPGYVPENPELQLARRLCVPIRCRGILLGFIWIIDRDGDLTDGQVEDSSSTAAAIGVLLHRRLVAAEERQALSLRLVEALTGAEPAVGAAARREILAEGLLDDDAHVAVLIAQCRAQGELTGPQSQGALDVAVQRFCRARPPGTVLAACRPRRAVVVLAQARELTSVQLREAAAGLHGELEAQSACPDGWRVGSGGPVAGLDEAFRACRQAVAAVAAARAEPSLGRAAEWSACGAYALLGQLDAAALSEVMLPHGVRALLESPAAGQLAPTVEAYLDCGCDAQRTARELGIHRTTLYYRLERAAQVSGLDLHDGKDRLLVHLALKLCRISGFPTPVASEAGALLRGAG